jgi:hypothetical protein
MWMLLAILAMVPVGMICRAYANQRNEREGRSKWDDLGDLK